MQHTVQHWEAENEANTNSISWQSGPKESFMVTGAFHKFVSNLSQTQLICTIFVNMQNKHIVQRCLGHGSPQI